ncbi:phosphatidate cytidylyltransferase [Utexia brackfieldae]|uniref:phosphatidate cytidylyltransferase n=1 Tax=Utexia brackfieldae TaxID=3074108 RepID=UPI00370D9786
MTSNAQDMFYLFLGIGVTLLVASIIGFILEKVKGNNAVISNLNARINAWWVMVIIIGVAFWLGNVAVILLFFLISACALREFMTMLPTTTDDDYPLVFSFYIVLPIQYILISLNWFEMFTFFIPIYVFLLLPILISLTGSTKDFLARTAKLQWGVMICVYCISCVPALLNLNIKDDDQDGHFLLIVFLLLVVQISDVFQYVVGKLFGRHKIAPMLSPSKTIEGFLGGILFASLLGTCLYWITPFSLLQAGLIALILTLSGFMGGLVMSAIKRDRGIKDWGNIIKGHGGMLDRFDSVCFAAPIFFYIVRYWWG